MYNDTELSYRKSAIAGASPIGLVIALYDTLSGDLRRAAAAIRNNDIERRCNELNHAALVLGQLENWIDKDSVDELASNLGTFYAFVRSRMLEASIRKSAPVLDDLIALVLQVRTAWQQRDEAGPMDSAAGDNIVHTHLSPTGLQERTAFSRTA